MKNILFLLLGVFAVTFLVLWWRIAREGKVKLGMPGPLLYVVGFVTQFLDTLGIGSFATMSACFKIFGLVKDEHIPGTLNIATVIPGIAEAFIYVAVVDVDVKTMSLMIAGSVLGAWLGAGVVSRWNRRRIQIGMGSVLLATAAFGLLRQLHFLPPGGNLLGFTGMSLVFSVLATIVLGALMTLGIGFFAPCMVVCFLLGMNPRAVFPIMMASVAFLCPVAGVPFLKRGVYDFKASLGITLGGVPGVLIAAFIVKELPLTYLQWLVIVVVVYTAVMMLRSAAIERARARAAAVAA